MRQKLAALKEKLKKVKSIEDKQKMLEQERDKELRQKETMKRKADAKALQKKKREALIGNKEIWAVRIKRFFPSLFWRIIKKQSANSISS